MKALSKHIKTALGLATKAHQGQTDKAGRPYIEHPVTVAMTLMANGCPEDCIIAGLLHDVAEDTEYGLAEIAEFGFGDKVMEALALLTHDKDESYFDYVRRIAQNPIAKAVKTADLMHNMDVSRLPKVTEKDMERMSKYRTAFDYLQKS